MQPSELLEATVEYLDEHGWCRGTMQQPDGRVCLLGALMSVYEGAVDSETWVDALDYLDAQCFGFEPYFKGKRVYTSGVGVVNFNDKSYRTKKEVIKLLSEGAKHFRNRGR